MSEAIFSLADGRRLGYGIYGDPSGIPILDFHGIPGSRREAELFHKFVVRSNVYFIGIDRPGYGHSSPRRNLHVVDFVPDVVELLDHLQIKRVTALGYSGGGPFALACARFIPERLAAVGIVSGVGPSDTGSAGMHEANRKKFNFAQQFPWLAEWMLRGAFSSLRRQPQKMNDQMHKIWQQMPEPDQKALADPVFANGIMEVSRDAVALGVSGWAREEILMAQPWGFDLREIRQSNLFLWHGCQDRNVPLAMAQATASQLPGCKMDFLPGESHLSILYNHGNQIIDALIHSIS